MAARRTLLGSDERREYAWRFLQINSKYREAYAEFKSVVCELEKHKTSSKKYLEILGVKKLLLKKFAAWGLKEPVDPSDLELRIKKNDSRGDVAAFVKRREKLLKMFGTLDPGCTFYDAPFEGDSRLYLAITPYEDNKTICKYVCSLLKERRHDLGICVSKHACSVNDLECYLKIIELMVERHGSFVPAGTKDNNYGFGRGTDKKFWIKLAEELCRKNLARDPKKFASTLRDTVFREAVWTFVHAPFSIFFNSGK